MSSDSENTFSVGGVGGGGVEKWRLKLTSAKVEVEVEAELGNRVYAEIEFSDVNLYEFVCLMQLCRICACFSNNFSIVLRLPIVHQC